jgi:hypothetical protein
MCSNKKLISTIEVQMKCDLLVSFFFVKLVSLQAMLKLVETPMGICKKKRLDHHYKALLKCYLLAFFFFAKILSLQMCFVLLTNFCSTYPSQRNTLSFTFVQGIPTSQNTKIMKNAKKNPFDPKLRSDFQ